MVSRVPARAGAAALALLCFASCSSYGASPREIGVGRRSGAEVWHAIQEFSLSRGFPADPAETDVGRRMFQSRWSGESGAFGRSRRRRFRAEIHPARGVEGDWMVLYYIEVEQVKNTSKSMAPKEEDWEYVGQDPLMEQMFRQVMYLRFGGTPDLRVGEPTGVGDGPPRG